MLVAFACAAGAPAAATTRAGCGERPAGAAASGLPVLLMFHSGAFIEGDPAVLDPAAAQARAAGFATVQVRYPLGNLAGAVAAAKAAARRCAFAGASVYAYGESAGGTLAALLAERDLALASATYSPIASLPAFARQLDYWAIYPTMIGATAAQMRLYSPKLHRTAKPVLALVAADDEPAFVRQILLWDRRDRMVWTRGVSGAHLRDPADPLYPETIAPALDWLAGLAGPTR